jgi:ketosteroid isomerase-like protein
MSEAVDVVKRVIDAFNRGDVEGAVGSFSHDFEFDFSQSRGPTSGIYRGRDGARGFLSSFFEPWAALEFDPQEITELQDGRVLGVNTVRGRGHESGAEVTATGATIWTIRDGEVATVTFYQSKAEALEAAGTSG